MNQLFFYKFDKPMVEFQGFVKGLKKPCLVISKVKWNDFGYETLFDLDFIDGKGEVRGISKVKIANSFDTYEISLDDSFQELLTNQVGLGKTGH